MSRTKLGSRAIYASYMETITGTETLKRGDSGKTLFLDSSGGAVALTLPSVTKNAGWEIKIKVKDSTTASTIADSTGSAILVGGIGADTGGYISMAGKTITMTTDAVQGDELCIVCDGTNYYVTGLTGHSAGFSVA